MEKSLNRICKTCDKVLKYKSIESFKCSEKEGTECRSCSTKKYVKRIGDANYLLTDNLDTYYWVGFILADGHIEDGRLSITLSGKDKEHLNKLSEHLYVKTQDKINNKKYSACILSLMHKDIINIFVDRFDIKSNKTINPPNINVFKNLDFDKLFSIFIGFTDGDGNIRKLHNRCDFHIRIKTHKNWLPVLDYFNNVLDLGGHTRINKLGYATLEISNSVFCKKIKEKAIGYNLPFLERKWSEIDLSFVGRNEKADQNKIAIFRMLNEGLSHKEIYKKLNISKSSYYQLIKRNNIC